MIYNRQGWPENEENSMTTNDQPMDHVAPEPTSDDNREHSEMEKNVKSRSTWLRLVFMLILGLLYGLSRVVLGAVVIIQFFYVLLSGETNDELKSFGHSLAIYSYQIVEFLTFNSDEKPFPFDSGWPTSLPRD
jgi:hypothetical protein